MILAVDVDYHKEGATIGGVLFENWSDEEAIREVVSNIDSVEEYVPGQFYKRELPCILKLLEEHALLVDTIVVDGYVFLGGDKKGLGHYLYEALEGTVSVIGVAKNSFHGIPQEWAVFRGESIKPLYITAVGMELAESKESIKSMAGEFRFPTLLKRVDSLCRGR